MLVDEAAGVGLAADAKHGDDDGGGIEAFSSVLNHWRGEDGGGAAVPAVRGPRRRRGQASALLVHDSSPAPPGDGGGVVWRRRRGAVLADGAEAGAELGGRRRHFSHSLPAAI